MSLYRSRRYRPVRVPENRSSVPGFWDKWGWLAVLLFMLGYATIWMVVIFTR